MSWNFRFQIRGKPVQMKLVMYGPNDTEFMYFCDAIKKSLAAPLPDDVLPLLMDLKY